MSDETISYALVTDRRDIQRVFAVRAIVFIEEQACPFDEEFDQFDEPQGRRSPVLHVLGTVASGEPVASARIRILSADSTDGAVAKLERLAIRNAWRGNGAGHALVKFMVNSARARGCESFVLNAQSHLRGFYELHGFSVSGPRFVEAGIDHLPMAWQSEDAGTRSD